MAAGIKTSVHVEGLSELADALAELPKATGKNAVRRTLIKALGPMESMAESLAPELTGQLRKTIEISTQLSRRQKSVHQAEIGSKPIRTAEGFRSSPQTEVFMFMGPASSPKSIVQEFGSVYQSPHPYMRPAWDANKLKALDTIRDDLWEEIDKARARLARKAARLAKLT